MKVENVERSLHLLGWSSTFGKVMHPHLRTTHLLVKGEPGHAMQGRANTQSPATPPLTMSCVVLQSIDARCRGRPHGESACR